MLESNEQINGAVDALLDKHRVSCLWFLAQDYYPSTLEARLQALGYLEKHGSVSAFQEASRLKQWLLLHSNEASAG